MHWAEDWLELPVFQIPVAVVEDVPEVGWVAAEVVREVWVETSLESRMPHHLPRPLRRCSVPINQRRRSVVSRADN